MHTDILSFGLFLVGFGFIWQHGSKKLNLERFRSHFGVSPKAIVKVLNDLEIKHHKRNEYVEHVMMALCWLKLYETEHVLEGR